MGAKKFLIENKYGQYLSANSGSSNAYTRPTSTNYFFDISAKPENDQDPSENNLSLREALDRFYPTLITHSVTSQPAISRFSRHSPRHVELM
jgi:secreted Zn-dependent insulinase-like peptidase